jgi:signal transduction histidine kinase
MTLQRLIREDDVAPPSSVPRLRAKLLHTRLRAVPYSARPSEPRVRAMEPEGTHGGAVLHESGVHETLLGELTRVLSSSLDYTGALREVTRIVSDRLGCGCVIELFEAAGPVHVVHQPPRSKAVKIEAFAPLVADVIARDRSAAATRVETFSGDRKGRLLAERARQEAGTEWVLCAPLSTEGVEPLGAVTMFGGAGRLAVPHELAREVAQRTAIAIRNGRLYRAALVAAHERQRVLSLVAHELKNPLGVILMGAAQALEGAPDLESTPNRRRELEAIHRSAKRMKKLVGDLLDLASIDAGKLSVRPTSCAISSVIAGALRDVKDSADLAGVCLVEDRLSDLPNAWVDPDRLSQVLVNLLSNAIKFTPRGGRIHVRGARVERNEIVIAIADTGRGIEEDDLEHVFDHFWQASDTVAMGSGLGLAICKSIVELSGGRIWAQSSVGVGTTMYFTLPSAA